MFDLIIVSLAIVFFSGIVSCVEAALFSVPLVKVREYGEKKKRKADTLIFLKEKIQKPIITLVVFNNFINIGGSIFAGALAGRIMGDVWLGIFSGALIFLIIIFSEIIPKNLGARYSLPISLVFAPILKFFIKIFSPFIWLLSRLPPLQRIGESLSLVTSEEEIKFLTGVGAKAGVIEEDEAKMIQSAFRLNDITAADIMTPRSLVFWLDGNKSLRQKRVKIGKCHQSRILVCDKDINKVMGICRKDDLLKSLVERKEDILIKEFASWVLFVPETRVADDLLRDFQKTKSHFAVVIDEHGEVEGVVTHEDILQELVGELISEKDIAPDLIKRISKKEILAHGQTKLAYINQFLNINLRGALTLNGFLLKKFEKFPQVGEVFETREAKLIVEKITEKSVEKVKIIKT
ncbi:MAG: hypothetical protein COV69_00870 [Parcubacteria group bacterium CG11_big_fil_rev_8_21_14_0_20_39_14]|nr:MAG: hypothetical protein COV69_00870 [Parcubacteria group bacterium CG11_big_fil_rev_8_21_14_0_20_39_14]PIS35562.1 MAG: HlyC/CorC family transporter [Parcubacteria group bacterium CG08_land_8_20_14_0_20_38_56]